MRLRFQSLLLGLGLVCQAAGETLSEARIAQSQSGQFVVSRAPGSTRTPAVSALLTNEQFLELETSLLVVSCERIKQALVREIGSSGPWQGKIRLRLRTARNVDDPINVTLERFRDRWDYRVELPDVIERARLMRVLVEVILLDMANQQAAARSAELPPWLAVGFAERLLSASEGSLLFAPPRARTGAVALGPMVATNRVDPLATAWTRLREQSPLTLQELSWPVENDFSGERSAAYRASAQVFVSELLRLPEGKACFRDLLRELPHFFNWQTAFLKAFQAHFERLLDLEKWWSLQSVSFTGRDPALTWSAEESWRKLEEALHVPVQLREAANRLPSGAAAVTLQTIIGEWDSMRQAPVLRERLQQFERLRQHLSPEFLPLLAEYRRVVSGYLEQREKAGLALPRGQVGRPVYKRLIADTVRQLNQLDSRSKELQQATSEPAPPPNPASGEPSS